MKSRQSQLIAKQSNGFCARRWLRDGDGFQQPYDRRREREVRVQPKSNWGLLRGVSETQRLPCPAVERGVPAAILMPEDDQTARGGLSHRARQRSRSGSGPISRAPKQF